jgi:hypothetical protein
VRLTRANARDLGQQYLGPFDHLVQEPPPPRGEGWAALPRPVSLRLVLGRWPEPGGIFLAAQSTVHLYDTAPAINWNRSVHG